MRRECTLCKQEFLHRSVEKMHEHLFLCTECKQAILSAGSYF